MATDADSQQFDEAITFEIFDTSDVDMANLFTEDITPGEKEEIVKVVDMVEGANSRELIDFIPDKNATRHLSVDESELDCLAGKNNALTTNYQTKWAVTVMRSKF